MGKNKKILSLACSLILVICLSACNEETTIPSDDCDHNWEVVDVLKEATCTKTGEVIAICTKCGVQEYQTTPIDPDNHNLSIQSNEETHWYTCKDCGYITEPEEHAFKYESTLVSGKHVGTCEICSYTLRTDYHLGIAEKNEYRHNGTCVICGETIDGVHIATSNTDNHCYLCGKILNTDGITYTNDRSNTGGYGVSKYSGSDESLFIPRSYESYSVTSIVSPSSKNLSRGVFYNAKFSIVGLPDTLVSIGDAAFASCRNLENIEFPESLTSIGWCGLIYCESLTSIYLPTSLESVGNETFAGCTSLSSVTFGDGCALSALPSYTFYNTAITSLEIPSQVTSIGQYAFAECSSLEYVIMPTSVTTIDNYSFNGSSSFSSVYYRGTESEWDEISIAYNNSTLNNASVYFYSENAPTEKDKYWHYDSDGVTPLVWEN